MKYTDDAVKYLLTELSASDKKTIVVFFGDHQPNDYVVEPIYEENGLDINNQTLEEQQKRQQVPSLSGQIMISRRKVILQLVLIIFLQKLPRLPVLALQNIKASSHRCQKYFLSSMQLAM